MRISFHKQHGKREEAAGGAVATAEKKRRRWPKRVIAIVLVVAIAGGGIWYFNRDNAAVPADTQSEYMTGQPSGYYPVALRQRHAGSGGFLFCDLSGRGGDSVCQL